MGRSRLRTRDVIIITVLAVLILIGIFTIGVWTGAKQTINWGVKVAMHFVNISVNEGELNGAIWRYKNQIGGCYSANTTLLNK